MALPLNGSDLGITKAQVAGLSLPEGVHPSGLSRFQRELSEQREVTQIGIDEEGSHCKCNALVLGFLALAAAGGAAWLFLSSGQGAFVPALMLCSVSTGFVIALAVTSILSSRRQKDLETQLQQQANGTASFDEILQAMEQPEVTGDSIKTIMGRLEEDQRRGFMREVFKIYAEREILAPDQQKVFNAIMADPSAIALITERPSAITVLRNIDPQSCSDDLLTSLIRLIKAPDSEEEASLIAKIPAANVQSYLDALREPEHTAYKRAFLEHMPSDTPLALVKELLLFPNSEQDALIFARHPLAVTAKAQAERGRAFALRMLKHLPPDNQPQLLETLLKVAGAPTSVAGEQILLRHPIALSHLIAAGGEYGISCLRFAVQDLALAEAIVIPQKDADMSVFARQPKTLALLAQTLPKWFFPEVVFSIFSRMKKPEQILFLQALAEAKLGSLERSRSQLVVAYILDHLLTKEFVAQYDLIPDFTIPQDFKDLMNEFSRWPEQVAERLFVKDFGEPSSLAHHPLIMRLLLESMSVENQEVCVQHAADLLSVQKGAVDLYTNWLSKQEVPHWLSRIVAHSPGVLAQVLCRTENVEILTNGTVIFSTMTPEQTALYYQKYLEHFIAHYEAMVFDRRIVTPELTAGLSQQICYLDAHPEWMTTAENRSIAKRYFELFVNAEIDEPILQTRLMAQYPDLFISFRVSLGGVEAAIPGYRLATISPVFERMLSARMREAQQQKVVLDDPEIRISSEEAQSFVDYLTTGKVKDGEENILALSHLAHRYEIWHLSALCTLRIREFLAQDVSNLKHVLDTAVGCGLWDLSCLCVEFVSKNRADSFISNHASNPHIPKSVRKLLQYGMSCSDHGFTVTYQPGPQVVMHSEQFGRYLSVPNNLRHVHLQNLTPSINQLNELQQLIIPTRWSAATCTLALDKVLSSYQEERKDFVKIFLQVAEETLAPGSLASVTFARTLTVYTLAHQQNKMALAAACLNRLKMTLATSELLHVLQAAQNYGLTDLTCICLGFAAQHCEDADILALAKSENVSEELQKILQLGINCGKLRIEISGHEGKHQVVVKQTARRDNQAALDALDDLHKVMKISHLQTEEYAFTDTLRSHMGYLGVEISYLRSA